MYPPPAALSDAVFATPARLVGGPAPLAPAPPQPDPQTRKVRPDLEYLAGGDRWGTLGGYYRSLPPWIDDLTREFGPDTYERMQLDDQVSSSLRALVYSVLSDDLVLRPGIDDQDDPDFAAAKDVLGFMGRATWEGRGGMDEWLKAMCHGALGGGNRVSETVLDPQESGKDAGKMVLGRLAVKPRRSFAFVVDAFNRLAGVGGVIPGRYGSPAPYGTTFSPDGPPPPNLLPREKFCVLSWDPPDGDPRGSALLRCVYEPWWAKLQAARDHLANLAQFGSPSLVAKTAPGADSSAATDGYGNPTPDGVVLTPEQDLLNQALAFRNGTVIVLPAGAELDALTVPNAGKAFAEKIDACDRAIAQGILLAMRAVMQSRFGSRADAEQGQDVAGLQTRFVKRWLARMVTEDLLRYLYRVNYGPNADPRLCPYASLSPVEHQDLGTGLVAVSTAFKAGVIKPSQLPWVHEQFGMPPATPEELAAPPPGPTAAPGAPPGTLPAPDNPPAPPQAPFAFDPAEPRVPAGSPGGGEWGSGGGGTAVAEKPPGKKPRVDVGLSDKEEAAIAKVIKANLKIRGGLTGEQLAALGGAPPDGQATVRVGADKKSLTIHVSNDFTAVRHLRRLGSGELIMENERIGVKPEEQGKGLGTAAFARQVDAARALGVGSIRCHAARYDAGGREAFNGYSTWPKLGYDQDFEDLEVQGDKDLADRARAEFPGVESVLQLMAVPGGKHWWAKNGTDLHRAKFDLSDGSDSMLVLGAYLDARKEDAARG